MAGIGVVLLMPLGIFLAPLVFIFGEGFLAPLENFNNLLSQWDTSFESTFNGAVASVIDFFDNIFQAIFNAAGGALL